MQLSGGMSHIFGPRNQSFDSLAWYTESCSLANPKNLSEAILIIVLLCENIIHNIGGDSFCYRISENNDCLSL